MSINSINKFIQQTFLTIPLKIVQSASWAVLAILAFPSFVINRKYYCFFAKKAVAIWNKNESSTTSKVNQVASSITLDKNSVEAILDQWTKNWWGTKNPNRILAQQEFLKFFYNEETHLNLANFNLTSLPDIFHFEQFSSKLKQLTLKDNQLKKLPESFGNLQALTTLNLSCCDQFKSLPESFGNLEALTTLNLLQALTIIYLSDCNRLTSLSESFGNLQALTTLKLIDNRLVSLPESFGNLQALTTLDLRCNRLTSLPESFGNLQALTTLDLSYNQLVSLPESIGNLQALTNLNLTSNISLSGLPMQILDLSRTCTIDLTGCNFSQAVLERIREITSSPTYAGPHISFSISDRTHRDEKSIEESLKDLYKIIDKPFIKFSNLEETLELRSWLNRLSDIADYKKQGSLQKAFANTIIRYLELANEDLAFRDAFYAVIQGAAETCGDGMSLSILDLGIVHKLATIDLKDTKTLADFLIKGPWAIEMLKEIARNKIPTLPFFDEIEVYLGYPIKLKEALNLPIDVQEMLYFTCSALKDEDLEEAKGFVLSKQTNQEACFTFLIGHDKWKKALKHNYPIEFKTAEENRDLALEDSEDYVAIEKKFNQELIALTKKTLT
ncbi:MAG: NEL-type E3 ubiquitin ligase domain-containing protein [Candidatus Rhabdochlamydia sp.]